LVLGALNPVSRSKFELDGTAPPIWNSAQPTQPTRSPRAQRISHVSRSTPWWSRCCAS